MSQEYSRTSSTFFDNQRISHCDQVQFLLETQELFNISKAINVAHHINKQKIKLCDHTNGCRNWLWAKSIIHPWFWGCGGKSLNKLGIKGNSLNLVKVICENLHNKRLETKSESEVAQLCPTLCDPMDCSLPGSSVHGIFQARVLEWVVISFSSMDVRVGL